MFIGLIFPDASESPVVLKIESLAPLAISPKDMLGFNLLRLAFCEAIIFNSGADVCSGENGIDPPHCSLKYLYPLTKTLCIYSLYCCDYWFI